MPKNKSKINSIIPLSKIAQHKLTVSSIETQSQNQFSPTIGIDWKNTPSYDDLIKMYWTSPLIFKGINLRTNKVIGMGFKLNISKKARDKKIAEDILNQCQGFIDKLGMNFFRQSIINAYVSGNEWTEIIKNPIEYVIGASHGDFKTIDFRRNYISNKIMLNDLGEPIGYWQYINNLAELHYTLSTYYNLVESWDNLQQARERLNATMEGEFVEPYMLHDFNGREIGAISRKPMYMFIKEDEIVHLSFNNLNDNYFGTSLIVPAYYVQKQLDQVFNATTEMINTIGYPKPVCKVGTPERPATQTDINKGNELVSNPVGKESFTIPEYYELSYLDNGKGNSDISTYPQWYITQIAIALRVPRELLTGEGESNRATALQGSTDFEKDCEIDRLRLIDYIKKILKNYLNSRGYNDMDYLPEVEWDAMITEDDALKDKMIMEKYSMGLISFSEARKMLDLPEIENYKRNNMFLDELKSNPINSTEMIDIAKKSDNTSIENSKNSQDKLAEFKMDTKSKINSNLNEKFNTNNVDYKEIAKEQIGKKIISISKTKANKIRDIIINGITRDNQNKTIINRIKKQGVSEPKAKTILRTELKTLTETAKYENAKSKGLQFKVWDAVMDKRTGEDSKALNGQVVGIDDNFKATWTDKKGKINKWEGKLPPERPNSRCRVHYINANIDEIDKLPDYVKKDVFKSHNIDKNTIKSLTREIKELSEQGNGEEEVLKTLKTNYSKILMTSPFLIGILTGLVASYYKKNKK